MEGNDVTADSGVLGDVTHSSLSAYSGNVKTERMALPCELQALGEDDQGRLRVRGVLHSFGPTYSRRLLHPNGFANWLKRNPGAKLPMLAQHGLQHSAAYSTVGEWDKIQLAGGKAVWEGWIGQGTELQAETRSLVKQGLIKQLSWGWITIKTAWVSVNDKDLDPHFGKILKENDWPEAKAFIEYDLVEGSVVDIADDPGAKLAAGRMAIETAVAPLKAEVEELRARVERMSAGRESPELAGTLEVIGETFESFLSRWQDRAIELLQGDALIGDAADEFRELAADLRDERRDGERADSNVERSGDAGLDELLQRVARGPGR
jgi:hypothetical protein